MSISSVNSINMTKRIINPVVTGQVTPKSKVAFGEVKDKVELSKHSVKIVK